MQDESSRLLDFLRTTLHDSKVKLHIEVDEAKAAAIQAQNEVARPITTKEKFEKMRDLNPHVSDLLQRFDLKLDE
ncbi:MAG: hypothetical protein IPL65_11580 [Lewinellaceae bacterium]|nr:hypothetical protein [Lewinellaceae bacterium]